MYAEMGTEARRQLDHYTQVRKRLNAYTPPPAIVIKPMALPKPVEMDHYAPLDMFSMCSWRFILAYVALKHGLKPRDILGYSRVKNIAAARHEAIYLVALHTQATLPKLGTFFNRDHSTICHSLSRFPKIDRWKPVNEDE